MFLDANPIGAAEPLRNPPAVTTNSQRNTGSTVRVPTSNYSRAMDEVSAAASGARAAPAKPAGPAKSFSLWENSDFGFGDFLDIINPLQHIPIVSTIYRNLSGDQIGMAPRVIGGALWGRIGGFVAGVINSLVEWITGKDIGDHIYAAVWGQPGGQGADNAVARAPDEPIPLPNDSQGEFLPRVGAALSTQVGTEVAPAEVPLTGTDAPLDEGRLHSAIAPAGLISNQILQSFYRQDDERNESGAAKVRLSV